MSEDEALPAPPRWRGLVVPVVALLAGAALGAGGFLAYSSTAGAEATPAEGEHGEAAAGEHGEAAAGEHGEAAGGHGEAAAGEHGGAAAGEHGGGEAGPPPATVENIGMFTVNLKGSGGGRVLRMEVQVESPRGIALVKTNQALLRDAVITLVSDYSWADVEGLEGKTRLRDELLQRMNSLLPSPVIERVYFTDFVVQ